MVIAFYIISALILLLPLFLPVKKEGRNIPTSAGIVFVSLVVISILLSIFIDREYQKQENKANYERTNYKKEIDSLKLIINQQYDTLKVLSKQLQFSFDKSMKDRDSANKLLKLSERPEIKIFDCKLVDNGKIQIRLTNDGESSATDFNSKYYFIVKPINDNEMKLITQKTFPI